MPSEAMIKVKYKSACGECHSNQTVTLTMKPAGLKLCPKTFKEKCLLDGHGLTFKLVEKRPKK